MRIVPVWPRSIEEFRGIVDDQVIDGLAKTATTMKGLKVLHINSTEYGGGVAEVLSAQIPMLESLSLDPHWGVIDGNEQFFEITKSVHNGFQGNKDIPWDIGMEVHYLRTVEDNIPTLPEGYDVCVVHDPQPMAIPTLLGDDRFRVAKKWIWRCHIDCADPHPDIWSFISRFLEPFDATVFTMKEFVQPDVPIDRVVISAPSIDPTSPKNSDLQSVTVSDICRQYQVDVRRPIMAQISRFDPWKDPHGVIRAYQIVKEQIPDVQLVLAGSLAHDDPEGLQIYDELLRDRGDDEDLKILSNFQQVGNTAINAFQRAANVVIQKSIREGFGLTVAEAAWKGKPVLGGRAGGITLQIVEGETGYLVETVEETADRSLELIQNPDHADTMGEAAREFIRDRFLTTRELEDWLNMFGSLA